LSAWNLGADSRYFSKIFGHVPGLMSLTLSTSKNFRCRWSAHTMMNRSSSRSALHARRISFTSALYLSTLLRQCVGPRAVLFRWPPRNRTCKNITLRHQIFVGQFTPRIYFGLRVYQFSQAFAKRVVLGTVRIVRRVENKPLLTPPA
jgi:hypothetical protein